MRKPTDGDFIVLIFGGKTFTRHARAFEAIRETDRLLDLGVPAFFIGWLEFRLEFALDSTFDFRFAPGFQTRILRSSRYRRSNSCGRRRRHATARSSGAK